MADAAIASCTEHPGRAVATTCLRCGSFICDWCVKLAPSWAPGLCVKCQRVKHASEPPVMALSRPYMLVSVALFIRPWLGVAATLVAVTVGVRAVELSDQALATQATFAIVAGAVLTLGAFVAMLLFWMRRKVARPFILGVYLLDTLDGVGALVLDLHGALSVLMVLRLMINLGLMVWVATADDARRMLVR
jgi:hypothetical protein